MIQKSYQFYKNLNKWPLIATLAASLYPLLYKYNANYALLNSWSQLLFCLITFIVLPAIVCYILNYVLASIGSLNRFNKYVLPVFNLVLFGGLIVINTIGFKKKILLLVILLATGLGILLYKHFKKVVVFQFLLAAVVLVQLIPILYRSFTYSLDWTEQPDAMENIMFKKRPNVYVIQADGYANFGELKKGFYDYDNSKFEKFLTDSGFKSYDGYRSNYSNTVTSNSSMFSMKHHYYNNPKKNINDPNKARFIIAGNNPVVSIFKNNNYKTSLLIERPYLLVNRPKIAYDYCNMPYEEIPYLSRGFDVSRDAITDLETAMSNNADRDNFYFIERIQPGHVRVAKSATMTWEDERKSYLKRIEMANDWLTEIVSLITSNDKSALIVIMADHGGFIGMSHSGEKHIKTENKDLITTIFTAALAIKWPGEAPEFDHKFKSNVNLFRVLFSYLGEDESYLDNLQDDRSYLIINEGAPFGVYQVIDNDGKVVFNSEL